MARVKQKMGDRLFDVFNYALLTLFLLAAAYPLYFMLIASFSDPSLVLSGQVTIWPRGLNLNAYNRVFKYDLVGSGYLNSIYYTVVGTVINLSLTLSAGFVISRRDLLGRGVIMLFFTITMFFGGGLIPTYLLVRDLGMINTPWALWLPHAVSVWNLIIVRTFFQTNIPDELQDAARIDGCSNTRFFISVVLPVSQAIIAVMVLFYAVGHWNSYFDAMIYISEDKRYPLQLVMRNLLTLNAADVAMTKDPDELLKAQRLVEMLKYALIIVATLPVMVIYPFIQKYFVKGIMIGSIKG